MPLYLYIKFAVLRKLLLGLVIQDFALRCTSCSVWLDTGDQYKQLIICLWGRPPQ